VAKLGADHPHHLPDGHLANPHPGTRKVRKSREAGIACDAEASKGKLGETIHTVMITGDPRGKLGWLTRTCTVEGLNPYKRVRVPFENSEGFHGTHGLPKHERVRYKGLGNSVQLK